MRLRLLEYVALVLEKRILEGTNLKTIRGLGAGWGGVGGYVCYVSCPFFRWRRLKVLHICTHTHIYVRIYDVNILPFVYIRIYLYLCMSFPTYRNCASEGGGGRGGDSQALSSL